MQGVKKGVIMQGYESSSPHVVNSKAIAGVYCSDALDDILSQLAFLHISLCHGNGQIVLTEQQQLGLRLILQNINQSIHQLL